MYYASKFGQATMIVIKSKWRHLWKILSTLFVTKIACHQSRCNNPKPSFDYPSYFNLLRSSFNSKHFDRINFDIDELIINYEVSFSNVQRAIRQPYGQEPIRDRDFNTNLIFSTIHQQKNFSNILWRIQIEILPRLESSLLNSKPIYGALY